jgi:Co/Zn/Cd efflux system component
VKAQELERARGAWRRVLWVMLTMDAAMLAAEFGAGIAARSTAPMADSLGKAGGTAVSAFSLCALHGSIGWRAAAAPGKAR